MFAVCAGAPLVNQMAHASALAPDLDYAASLLASASLPAVLSRELAPAQVRLVAESFRVAFCPEPETAEVPLVVGNSLASTSDFHFASVAHEAPLRELLVPQPQSAQLTLVVKGAVAARTHRFRGMVADDSAG